jgi:hypothetical protein
MHQPVFGGRGKHLHRHRLLLTLTPILYQNRLSVNCQHVILVSEVSMNLSVHVLLFIVKDILINTMPLFFV